MISLDVQVASLMRFDPHYRRWGAFDFPDEGDSELDQLLSTIEGQSRTMAFKLKLVADE
jgi:hypothetical protein